MRHEINTCVKKLLWATSIGIVLYGALLYCSETQREHDISIFHLEQINQRLKQDTYWPRIIMGDSRALAVNYHGAASEEIYNFAFSNTGGMYPYVYFLHRYLENHPPPREILWSFIPLMLTDTWEIFKHPAPVDAGEIYRAARLYTLPDMLIPGAASDVFYQYPLSTKAIIEAKFRVDPEAVIKFFTCEGPAPNFGGLYKPKTGALLFSTDKEWEYTPTNYLEETEFVIAEQGIKFMRRFLALAQQHNIRVHSFNMPIPEPIHSKRMKSGFYARYFEVMQRMQAEFPHTFTYSRNIPALPSRFFIDGSHLNAMGTRKFMATWWDYISAQE